MIPALFALAVGGPWLWFRSGAGTAESHLAFEPRTTIPGWDFRPEPVGASARETLGTSDLTNGRFSASDGRSVTVFAANWKAASLRSMSVVQHTPDICWVGAGWEPVDAGQPRQVRLTFDGEEVPFECRAFSAPGAAHRELVVWCTLVGGRILSESSLWTESPASTGTRRDRAVTAYRRVAVDQFVGNVRNRRRGSADKQFVRFSVPLRDDWSKALEEVRRFGGQWLVFRRTTTEPEARNVTGP